MFGAELLVSVDRLVIGQVVTRVIGCCNEFDVEFVHQLAWAMRFVVDPALNLVVYYVRRFGARTLGNTKNAYQLIRHPVTHRCAVVIAPMCAECPPGVAIIFLRHLLAADTQLRQFDAVSVHDSIDVVVWGQQKLGRISE